MMTRQMKSSGVEWIGDIPEKWNVRKLFQVFTQVKNKNQGMVETNLLSLSYGKIKQKNIETSFGLLPESFETYNIIDKNDIVLRLTDLQNDQKSLRVGLSTQRGIITSAYVTMRAKNPRMAPYLYYLLHTFDIEKGFYGMGDGVRQGLNWDELKHLSFVLPSLSEQQKIADYLNEKCGAIDEIIAKMEQSVEEYKKLKQAAITEAVTKGIRPNRKMKDSGIEWIGEIPEDWNINKIKRFLRYVSTKDKGNCEVLSLYRELGIVPKNSRNDNHNVTAEDTSNYRFVRKGDFVINKMKAWQGSVAVSDFDGIVSPAYFVYEFISNVFVKKYFHYLLRNKQYAKEFERLSGGIRIGQWDLPAIEFENTVCLVPSLPEQKEIADYLDKKCAEIDTLIEKKQKFLTELATYKKSMIYEYVTGKKEVA